MPSRRSTARRVRHANQERARDAEVGVLRGRFDEAWRRVAESRVYQMCFLVTGVSITLWLALGWGRQWYLAAHLVTWAFIIEMARRAEADRRWARHARPLEWHLSPVRAAIYIVAAALLMLTGLAAIGYLAR